MHEERIKRQASLRLAVRHGRLKMAGGILLEVEAARTSVRAGGSIGRHTDDEQRATARAEDAAEGIRALRAFLAGFGIDAGQHRDLLAEKLLPGVLARRRHHAEHSLGACAIGHAEEVFECWLTGVLGAERLAGQPALPIGRAAFLACGGPTNWPELVLVDEGLPDVFVAAMRAAAPSLAPMPAPGTMAAQSLEAWSIADAGRAVVELLDAHLAWRAPARPLILPIRLGKPSS